MSLKNYASGVSIFLLILAVRVIPNTRPDQTFTWTAVKAIGNSGWLILKIITVLA